MIEIDWLTDTEEHYFQKNKRIQKSRNVMNVHCGKVARGVRKYKKFLPVLSSAKSLLSDTGIQNLHFRVASN